jgi:octaprenyl-diphosphate synthase
MAMRNQVSNSTREESKLKPQDFFKLVEKDLVQVEQELHRQSTSNVQLIDRIGRYIHDSGGKRLRPAMLLLSAQMSGFEGPACHRLGAVVEMIHSATLVHDDIIDDAKVRRGHASVNAHWGNEITVLMGDWLYMTSFQIALAERNFKILDILIDVTRKMIEGELLQLSVSRNPDVTEEQHLDISMRKTAFLFSACTQMGGVLGSVNLEQEEALRLFGLQLGMAFQLVDDVLDITSTESTLGKPVCSDLKEGKLTLPLIYLMRDGQPEHRELIRAIVRENGFGGAHREKILDLVREYGTAERVLEKASDYACQARNCLAGFPESQARDALMAIPEYIVERDR